MTIKFALNKNEVDSSKKLAKALADKFKAKSAIAEEKEDVCVAKNGFKFEAKYVVEGGCNVEIVIPEWVTTEVNAVLPAEELRYAGKRSQCAQVRFRVPWLRDQGYQEGYSRGSKSTVTTKFC